MDGTAQRREEILNAAEALLVERGFLATRIDDIAERIGVAHGTIYSYFSSKNELILSLIEDRLKRHNQAKQEALSQASSIDDVIEALVSLEIRFHVQHRQLLDIARIHLPSFPKEVLEKNRALIEDGRTTIIKHLARILGDRAQVPPDLAADVLEGAIRHAVVRWFFEHKNCADEEALESQQRFVKGLKAILTPGLTVNRQQ